MAGIYTLEGNIGAGKTTLISKLRDIKLKKPHIVLLEPVDTWMSTRTSDDQPSIFEMYYMDKSRYGFMFQMLALQSRMEFLYKTVQENPDKIIICERCYLTDLEIFAKMLHSENIINDAEFLIYKKWFDFLIGILKPNLKGVLYLRVEPDICLARIVKRHRKGENNIDIGYIDKVHQMHETWLCADIDNNQSSLPVCCIDGNAELVDDRYSEGVLETIVEFINRNIVCS